MLTQLTIHNFALVDQLELELQRGMTAITGETGAGKSIMLDALGLALGDRADLDVIRTGAERSDISATFALDDNPDAQGWLQDHDFPSDEGQCILRRVLTRDGRSRAYINGQATTLAELKTLGEMLIDIHSQHEHQSLLKTATHQRLLDAFGGHQEPAQQVSRLAGMLRSLGQQIRDLQSAAAEGNAQRELLSYQVRELEELRLQPGEFSTLEAEHEQLTHADAALAALKAVTDLCSDNDEFNLEQGLRRATHLLTEIPFSNPQLEEAAGMLNNALIQVEEAASTLARASDRIELNPQRLQDVDERLGAIHRMARKHKVDPDKLFEHAQALQAQLLGLDSADTQVEKLQIDMEAKLALYHQAAAKLSQLRTKAARKLEKEINTQLGKLGMAAAKFSIDLNSATNADNKGAPGNNGYDAAEFMVSTNPGNPPKPLAKVASGGELSRISLAIQVVIAHTTTIPTLVFDEVDVGIGGGTAKAVGELLRQLGEKGQVLCVTHQPQVASQAHQHLLVTKVQDKQSTATSLRHLDIQDRISEIARMLGGDKLTDKSLAHARELLA
jgi:DNA repair protein RecN (Recombination protein N)